MGDVITLRGGDFVVLEFTRGDGRGVAKLRELIRRKRGEGTAGLPVVVMRGEPPDNHSRRWRRSRAVRTIQASAARWLRRRRLRMLCLCLHRCKWGRAIEVVEPYI